MNEAWDLLLRFSCRGNAEKIGERDEVHGEHAAMHERGKLARHIYPVGQVG